MDVCLMAIDLKQEARIKAPHKFVNTLSGFKQLHQWCKKHCKQIAPLHVLMEATGVYYEKLAIYGRSGLRGKRSTSQQSAAYAQKSLRRRHGCRGIAPQFGIFAHS